MRLFCSLANPLCVVCRALVKSVAPEGPVMVTWANLHYLDFVLNWVEHVRMCGVKSFLVGAMDDKILQVTACTQAHTGLR